MSATLFRDVDVRGRRTDVLVRDGVISAVGTGLAAADAVVVEGGGGALLPGLHDHHLHLLAMAAALTSVDCRDAPDRQALRRILAEAPGEWVRAVQYEESTHGQLDRHALDELIDDRPVRVQHRSGALWVLNSRAIEAVQGVLDQTDDVERDLLGTPTGRLWRYDDRLRPALPAISPDLVPVGRQLNNFGITRVTDATPSLSAGPVDVLGQAVSRGELPQTVTLLGAPGGVLPAGMLPGAWKILLRDHDLPSLDELCTMVGEQHAEGRPVAVHCVTRESLLLTVAAWEEVGSIQGDRVEHGSVVPPETRSDLERLAVAVVTQPDFLRTRGDFYLRKVAPADLDCLYPYRSLLEAGIPVASSSDAPFGDADPWKAILSAQARRTSTGRSIGPNESVSSEVALQGYFTDVPGGPERKIAPGMPGDVVLMYTPYSDVVGAPAADKVRLALTL